jgi:hypothetical protein
MRDRRTLAEIVAEAKSRFYIVDWRLEIRGRVVKRGRNNLFHESWQAFVRDKEVIGRDLKGNETLYVTATVGEDEVTKVIQPYKT